MNEKEKLKWLIDHEGDCHETPWNCEHCPLDDQCGFGLINEHTVSVAKILLYNRQAVEKIHQGISAMKEIDRVSFHRDDHVMADGKEWRIDYTDGPYLGLSAPDGSHKELHKNVCEKVSTKADRVADILAMITMP